MIGSTSPVYSCVMAGKGVLQSAAKTERLVDIRSDAFKLIKFLNCFYICEEFLLKGYTRTVDQCS